MKAGLVAGICVGAVLAVGGLALFLVAKDVDDAAKWCGIIGLFLGTALSIVSIAITLRGGRDDGRRAGRRSNTRNSVKGKVKGNVIQADSITFRSDERDYRL